MEPKNSRKIALGGSCHWCTEAVFQSLIGVEKVEQGYVASKGIASSFSEAVIVHYKPKIIDLQTLIEIHLITHKSTSEHSMRDKYRSAIYYYNESQKLKIQQILNSLQPNYANKIITQILQFVSFQPSREEITDYFYRNLKKPFCEKFILPKLKVLLENFPEVSDKNRLEKVNLS